MKKSDLSQLALYESNTENKLFNLTFIQRKRKFICNNCYEEKIIAKMGDTERYCFYKSKREYYTNFQYKNHLHERVCI